MPTVYSDQFYVMDPGNPPPAGTVLTVQRFSFTDGNDDNLIRPNVGDSFNGRQITSVWQGDTVRVRIDGVNVTITGVTFYTSGGPAVFTPTDGTILKDGVFRSSTFVTQSTQLAVGSLGPPCFVSGTMIATPAGLRAVETLRAGDSILTQDDGPQPLRWAGSRHCTGTADNAPVSFAPAAIGNTTRLMVSPQHRILLSGWKAQLYFGAEEVLVPAKHLVNGTTIRRAPCSKVTYFHLLFDRHQILYSAGAATESLHPGDTMLRDNPRIAAQITAIFPELATEAGRSGWRTARPVARLREAKLLIAA